jgi:hypothetical protein
MTTAAAASIAARTGGHFRGWLSVRQSLRGELVLVLGLYGLYEATRGRSPAAEAWLSATPAA